MNDPPVNIDCSIGHRAQIPEHKSKAHLMRDNQIVTRRNALSEFGHNQQCEHPFLNISSFILIFKVFELKLSRQI